MHARVSRLLPITVICLSIITVQGAMLIGTASGVTVTPGYQQTAPVIDGVREGLWDRLDNTNRPTVTAETRPLRVHVTLFGNFVYMGLLFQKVDHHQNESFAVLCSNKGPENQTSLVSLYDYDAAKVVRINGQSYDVEVVRGENRTRNNPLGNLMELAVGRDESNHTFYEFRFRLEPDRAGDITWTPPGKYSFRIYHGTSYFNETSPQFGEPNLAAWTAAGSIFTIDIPEPGASPITGDITAGEFNTLVAKVSMFVVAAGMFAMIGMYVIGSRNRIKRM